MHRLRRAFALALAALLLTSLAAAPRALADHDDGVIEIPSLTQYDDTHLSVVIVPPTHGQIYNFDSGVLNGEDPNELTPFNSYLSAIEAAIAAWDDAVNLLGAQWIKDAYRVDVYVAGRDTIPPDVAAAPDILVVTDEDGGGALGTAIRLRPCIVRMSKFSILSFSWADMYNVTAQEFGHCLGIQHVGSQGGIDPTSEQKHPEHDVMNGFYTHLVGDEGTHLHCISNLDIMALEFTFSHVNPALLATAGPHATSYMPIDKYGDTCSPPPADWRTYATTVSADPEPEPSPEPEDEGFVTSISTPTQGSKIQPRRFKTVAGIGTGPGAATGSVHVALGRVVSETDCEWWSVDAKQFVRSSCLDALWNRASGNEEWILDVGARLPQGRYRVMSMGTWADEAEMCCEKGRNLIAFRLTS